MLPISILCYAGGTANGAHGNVRAILRFDKFLTHIQMKLVFKLVFLILSTRLETKKHMVWFTQLFYFHFILINYAINCSTNRFRLATRRYLANPISH